MSSALAELDVPPPRPDALCQRYARRMDPWWGFAIAAALITLFAVVITSVLAIKLMGWLGIRDGSTGAKIVSGGILVVGTVAARQVFRRWRRRRLAVKRRLVRDGVIHEVRVAASRRELLPSGTRQFSAIVRVVGPQVDEDVGFNLWFSPPVGTTIRVLHEPGLRPVVAFDAAGRMYNGLVL